ncbi:MAG: hypothetical protein AAGB22_00870, partial [Bacteroidota bacterium]
IARAYAICCYQDGRDMHPQQEKHEASYEDLLSYYNQRDHRFINRSLIKTPLELLLRSEVQADDPTQHPS